MIGFLDSCFISRSILLLVVFLVVVCSLNKKKINKKEKKYNNKKLIIKIKQENIRKIIKKYFEIRRKKN